MKMDFRNILDPAKKRNCSNLYSGLVCIEEGEVDVSSGEEQFTVYWFPNVLRSPISTVKSTSSPKQSVSK